MEQTFSDYLWNVRPQKAKKLTAKGHMTIYGISVAVGYLNTSSLRANLSKRQAAFRLSIGRMNISLPCRRDMYCNELVAMV